MGPSAAMREWTATTTIEARPEAILDVLTDPEACARWAPIPFDVEDLRTPRLRCGSRARVSGKLAGKRVGFDVQVHEAVDGRLRLSAEGPVGFDVRYDLAPAPRGSEVRAAVTVRPARGITGRLLATRRRDPMLHETIANSAPTLGVAAAVSAQAVARRYGEGEAAVDALRGVTIDVPAGQFTAIMGPSGSGKSTLMHLLAGLDRATEGTVHIGDQDITTMSDKALTKLRRRHIGFVFQSFNLLPTLSAEENVLLPLTIAGRKVDREALDALLERVGLSERRRHRPSELSGGQQQRVAIARALISEPTVLFADEPTGNLDSTAGAQVLDLLRDVVDLDGQTTVMVTHDQRAAARADRVLFLADGRIVADLVEPTEADVLAQMKAVSA